MIRSYIKTFVDLTLFAFDLCSKFSKFKVPLVTQNRRNRFSDIKWVSKHSGPRSYTQANKPHQYAWKRKNKIKL
jgi:hypothetical protein